MEKDSLLEAIALAVERADKAEVKTLIEQALDGGIPPVAAAEHGLALGLRRCGDKWSEGELFLPELVCAADAMKAGMAVLEPRLTADSTAAPSLGAVVIGTVQGDIHDIGKNLVATMLQATGFDVVDLGKDVPIGRFIEAAQEVAARMICMSALLTTTMVRQAELIEELARRGLRERYTVLCGGCPVTPEWARSIGADGTAPDAVSAFRLARSLVAP